MSDVTRCLLGQHAELERLLRAHQCALMALDWSGAVDLLRRFAELLARHLDVEERVLLPLYESLGASSPRFGPELLRAEHERILHLLAGIGGALGELALRDAAARDDVLDLLDRELTFKRFLHHHGERERIGLLATIDRALADRELEELHQRMGGGAAFGGDPDSNEVLR